MLEVDDCFNTEIQSYFTVERIRTLGCNNALQKPDSAGKKLGLVVLMNIIIIIV